MRAPRKPRAPREPRQARQWKPYIELLKDPRWQRRRLEVLERDGWECQNCGSDDKTLHVHHTRYERGKMPWEARDSYLTTLCETCHEETTFWKREVDAALADVHPASMARIAGFIQGMALKYSVNGVPGEPVRVTDHEQACGIMAVALAPLSDGDPIIKIIREREGHRLDWEDLDAIEKQAQEAANKARGRG